ncbi:MAG TPA: ribonuclease P protein component, partial [Oceanospirillales bacterium]|nr:ribonuclease P protein component [Oceanospirillales bacterium]
HSRLGLVISKKVDKRAVQRNRIKRISRETFRNTKFASSCDFVVLARPNITRLANKELFNSLDQLWNKAQSRIEQIRKK